MFAFGLQSLFGRLLRLLFGYGAVLGEFLLVERQPEVDARAQPGAPLGRGMLDIDAGILLVQEVDPFVEIHLADVEPQFPQAALGLLEREPDQTRYDRRAVAAFDTHIERHARAQFGLDLARRRYGAAVAVFVQYVVGRHVGAVDQLVDLQPRDLQHVLGLPQRTSRHVGHGHHLLAEGVDRDVDRAAGLDLHAPFGQLVEDDAPFVSRHEQRVVDVQLEVVLAGHALCLVELHARKVGHRAPCAVARADLHDDVGRDGHRQDDRPDQYEVVCQ